MGRPGAAAIGVVPVFRLTPSLVDEPAAVDADGSAQALATSTTAVVYTPAQIRAAYGLSALPAQTLANKGAYQGAGQTIYIVDAYHNPNIANDLAVFNQKFGLATCGTLAIPANARLPLTAAAAGSGCTLSVVYAAKGSTTRTPTGALTATVPAVNKSWATEITLDVQWAHAIAPLACASSSSKRSRPPCPI
jgi:subtilase family serine protease